MGVDNRESAFRDSDYVDQVIKIEIRGETVDQIDHVASEAGLTSAQWIRVTIAAELLRSTDLTKYTQLPDGSILGR